MTRHSRPFAIAVLLNTLLPIRFAAAQHEGHAHPPAPAPPATRTATPTASPPTSARVPDDPDPMARMEAMPAMDHWMWMLHGFAFLTANRQGGASGERDFGSQNHLIVMGTRLLWGGKLSLLGTFTLEPMTIPLRGSSELFQRGETYHGTLLIDRQHPHELFVQLAAAWEKELGPAKLRLYAAPVGEPAIGPVAYPHRLSASDNPTAPLAHHNQDSTHISYDVLTAGVTLPYVTLEGSAFHGAEPDENRFNIEQGRLDSYSGRLWLRPLPGLSAQLSVAHLEEPEALEDGNQTRATASVSYQRTSADGFVAVSLISGRNRTHEGPEWGHTLEGVWRFARKNTLFMRLERVDRDATELLTKRQRPETTPNRRVHVAAATLGAVRELPLLKGAETAIGADLTLYRFPSSLDSVYGRRPVSVHGFVRIRFEKHLGMTGGDHAGHAGHTHDAP